MKWNTLLLTTLLGTSMSFGSDVNTTSEMTVKQEGMKYIKMLGGALKSELQIHMKADRTGVSAMAFCTAKADTLTKEVNTKLPSYASVRRTSVKIRNEANAPDALDTKVMEEFEASLIAKTFSLSDIKVVKDGNTTRIYKPLVTTGACLKCHGSDINKDIQAQIATHYPKDKAVAFQVGSLRGVIVSEIQKH